MKKFNKETMVTIVEDISERYLVHLIQPSLD